MATIQSSGYSFGNDGKKAHILHSGNWVQPWQEGTFVELYGATGENVWNNTLTWERFSGRTGIDFPADSDATDFTGWTATRSTLGGDNVTLTADAATSSTHSIDFNWTTAIANDLVVNVRVKPLTNCSGAQVQFRDAAATSTTVRFFADATTGDLTTSTVAGAPAAVKVIRDPDGYLVCTFRVVSLTAGSVDLFVGILDTANAASYTAAGNESFELSFAAATTYTTIQNSIVFNQPVTLNCFALAAHNLAYCGALVQILGSTDYGSSYSTIVSVTNDLILDNEPIMAFFTAAEYSAVQFRIRNGYLPEVGVTKWGNALVMERPFYGGFAPAKGSRAATYRNNLSAGGQVLGRTRIRNGASVSMSWNNLTFAQVQTDLYGPRGLIQSAEKEPFFAAWRPEQEEHVDYISMTGAEAPTALGQRDLFSFSMSGEVFLD